MIHVMGPVEAIIQTLAGQVVHVGKEGNVDLDVQGVKKKIPVLLSES
tara:strand:+ start:1305 stop:1445 length:141 start_codon:yes stop_codon:yes gene_type:complete